MTSSDPCLLLQLPLELREQMYRYALPHTPEKELEFDCWVPCNEFPYMQWLPGNLVLLRAIRQIYQEATSVFWSANMFEILVLDFGMRLCLEYNNMESRRHRDI